MSHYAHLKYLGNEGRVFWYIYMHTKYIYTLFLLYIGVMFYTYKKVEKYNEHLYYGKICCIRKAEK